MTVKQPHIDPERIRLPGYMAGTVAIADDESLRQCRANDYKAIRSLLEEDGYNPTDEGLAPDAWRESIPRGKINTLTNVERAERRIQAINEELERRETDRAAKREAEQRAAREQLERLLSEAPEKARELTEAATEARGAVERIRQLLSDVETVGRLGNVMETYRKVVEGTVKAAELLNRDAPELPSMPDVVPTRADRERMHELFVGRRAAGGWEDSFRSGDYPKVREICRKL